MNTTSLQASPPGSPPLPTHPAAARGPAHPVDSRIDPAPSQPRARSGPALRPRVGSLLPAATEIVCALGLQDALVGVSHECDWPPSVRGLPVLTRTRLGAHGVTPAQGTSGAIDRDLRELLRSALAVYDLDLEALARAAPEVILTQNLCDVCAVPFAAVEGAARELLPGAKLVCLSPLRLADLWRDIAAVAEALGAPERAVALTQDLQGRLAALAARTGRLPRRPRVLTLEWLEPVMVGGTWMPELVKIAGGTALAAEVGQRARTLSREELFKLRPAPDVVVIKPCGFTLERTLAEFDFLRGLLAPLPWPAVRDGEVFVADGNAFFNRPGPRLVESAEILAAVLHGGHFPDLSDRHAQSYVRLARR